jgi:hypothetical protein
LWTHRTFNLPSISGGEGLTIGDMDRDGDDDIVLARYWYENDGDMISGSWEEHEYTHSYTYEHNDVKVGDLNNDGRVDIVLTPSEKANSFYHVSWFEAPEDAKRCCWEEHSIDDSVESVMHSLGIADMDLDGDMDVITAEMHQGADPDEIRVYLNGNDGGLSWTKFVVDTIGSHNVRVVDVDNDGDYDIFGANWTNSNQVDLWENQTRAGTSLDKWTYIQVDSSRNKRYFGLAMGDLTNDGMKDIASGQYFYRNNGGDLTSWTRVAFPVANIDALLIGNVDGDVYGDVIAMDENGGVYWLETIDANGNAWNAMQIGQFSGTDHGVSAQGYAWGDVVAGGGPEIILKGKENNVDKMFYFEIPYVPTAGNWPRTEIDSNVYPEGIGVGDIDGDGDIDVVSGKTAEGIAWWENASWTSYEIGSTPNPIADRFYVADLNGDNKRDIVVSVANGGSDGLYWFEPPADPQSTSWTSHTIVTRPFCNSLDVADMDGDGDIDIISGQHREQERLSIWENDGNANFQEHLIDSGKESHLGSRVSDLDNDGDLDIVSIAWDDYQYLHLWRNDANP